MEWPEQILPPPGFQKPGTTSMKTARTTKPQLMPDTPLPNSRDAAWITRRRGLRPIRPSLRSSTSGRANRRHLCWPLHYRSPQVNEPVHSRRTPSSATTPLPAERNIYRGPALRNAYRPRQHADALTTFPILKRTVRPPRLLAPVHACPRQSSRYLQYQGGCRNWRSSTSWAGASALSQALLSRMNTNGIS